MKAWPSWSYNPRPKGWGPADPLRGRRVKLQQLVTQCTQDEDGVYHLDGTTFRMTISEYADLELWR